MTSATAAVLVRVGEPAARVVPVLAGWEDEVLDLAATAGGEFLVGGRSTARNRAGALAASLVVGNGRPRFSASRLRSTWLVTHLAMGTRLPELARAAGLQGVTVLSDLLAFVPALDDDEALDDAAGCPMRRRAPLDGDGGRADHQRRSADRLPGRGPLRRRPRPVAAVGRRGRPAPHDQRPRPAGRLPAQRPGPPSPGAIWSRWPGSSTP